MTAAANIMVSLPLQLEAVLLLIHVPTQTTILSLGLTP